jgi:hypothetical protein
MAQIWSNARRKANPGGTNQAGDGGARAAICIGARHGVRFGQGSAADVAYMSQIGDIFDIVQQIAESVP